MSNSTTLMAGGRGSKHFGTKPFLGQVFERTGVKKPQMLYLGAASDDNRAFGAALIAIARLAGAGKVHWPKLSGRKPEGKLARELLEQVDVVFVGGGDVEAGMQHLLANDVVDALHAAHGRGVVFCGMSAGAIMLGERWIRWPGEEAGDEHAETFACLGIVPFSLDTHGEEDGWGEAKSFAAVRARETGKVATCYGVPSGGALLGASSGSAKALGIPAQHFSAAPGKKARALADIKVDEHD